MDILYIKKLSNIEIDVEFYKKFIYNGFIYT